MTIEQMNTLTVLGGLIATCGGSRSGFATAAAEVTDTRLKPLLIVIGEQRAAFLRELRDLAERFGGADEDLAAADLAARRWAKLRDAVARHDTPAVLAECERGDQATLDAYAKALDVQRLMPDARTIVSRQLDSVRRTQEQIQHLREETQS